MTLTREEYFPQKHIKRCKVFAIFLSFKKDLVYAKKHSNKINSLAKMYLFVCKWQ